MRHLLHLDTSMRTEGSRSRKLSAYFADAWRAANPGGTVTYRDLAANPVPHLDIDSFTANFLAASDRIRMQVLQQQYRREQSPPGMARAIVIRA